MNGAQGCPQILLGLQGNRVTLACTRLYFVNIRVKICGITQVDQGVAIAQLGASALGFICVRRSPRYLAPAQIRTLTTHLPPLTRQGHPLTRVGVFANASLDTIAHTVNVGQLTGVQLHGDEPPEFCQQLRAALPHVELLKALRVKTADSLTQIQSYQGIVQGLLLDAYTAKALGGTGTTWDWSLLNTVQPACPWLLAGGLTPDNIQQAWAQLHPPGVDLSSGVERAPGDKNLDQVQRLFQTLQTLGLTPQ